MLRAINTTQTFVSLIEKKCAEIYFRKENSFTILCTHCELKTFDFEEYVQHFQNSHLLTSNPLGGDKSTTKITDPVEVQIKTEGDDADQFGPLSESQEIPLAEVSYFSPASGGGEDSAYRLKVDILNNDDDKEWKIFDDECDAMENTNSDNEEHSDEDPEYIPRILNTDRRPRKTSTSATADHVCSECDKSYKIAKNLQRHITKCHSKSNNPYQCVRCEQNFPDDRTLYAHQRKKHSGYPCGECEKVYTSRESLNVHRYRHTGERNFHCTADGCGKSFFNPKNLAMHTRIVHRLEKNFVCEVCGFRTKGRPALIVHKRSHTGEKPFICKLCGKGFASKSLLCEHEPSHSTERRHVCNVCGRSFARPKALYHHKFLHSEVKQFVCKLCGRAYAQMAGLAGHMRQHRSEK